MTALPSVDVVSNGRTARFNGTWYRGKSANFIPSKADLGMSDAIDRYVMQGWAPGKPMITRDQPILAIGSCFARHVSEFLHLRGYNVLGKDLTNHAHILRFGEGMVNTFSIVQQLEWSLQGKHIPDNLWFSEHKDICIVDPAIREETRAIVQEADVFVLTLGLSEIWYDKRNGEALWRAVPSFLFDEAVHGFRVSSVEENFANLLRIHELIRQARPSAPIIFTLSPVPLMATFRPVSCITASMVSKAILRVAIDQLMRERASDDRLFYFPSYEIVKEFCVDPYLEDNRHPKPEVVGLAMETFERYYCIQ